MQPSLPRRIGVTRQEIAESRATKEHGNELYNLMS
jgi:hypothetical protein